MRRTSRIAGMLGIAAAALAAMGGVAAAAPPPANSAWVETNYNAANSRANLAETTLTTSTIGRVALRRAVTAAGNPDAACEGDEGVVAPMLSGGFAYAVFNGYLEKVNAGTGAVSWRVAPDTSFSTRYTSIAVSGSLVILAGFDCPSQSDPNGFVAAFRISDGSLAWTGGPEPLLTMVAASGSLLTAGSTLGSGESVKAINATTGATTWSVTADACGPVGAVVVGGLAIYTYCNPDGTQTLRGANLSTGAVVWNKPGTWRPVAGDKSASAGTHLFAVAGSGKIYDINPATGATRTRIAGAKQVLAVDGSRVYATCGSATGQVCGYALSSGLQQWNVTTGSAVTLGAFAGGVLYLSSGKALTASSGATIRSIYTGAASSLVVGDGRIGAVVTAQKLSIYGLAGA